MNRPLRSYLAVAQLDLAEVLRSRWLLFCVIVYAVLAVVFLMVGKLLDAKEPGKLPVIAAFFSRLRRNGFYTG